MSFLGAGTIIRGQRDRVEGLTTAASLLFVTGIGVCVAPRQFLLVGIVVVLVTLRGVGILQRRLSSRAEREAASHKG